MTDYITDLRDALHDAAAREYSAARAPRPSRARTRGLRRVLVPARPTAVAGISLLAAVAAAMVVLVLGGTATTQPAYALVQHPDGSVTVTVHNLRTAESPPTRVWPPWASMSESSPSATLARAIIWRSCTPSNILSSPAALDLHATREPQVPRHRGLGLHRHRP